MKATEKVKTRCCSSLCRVIAPWLCTVFCFLHIEAWENSWHFTMQPLVSLWNDVWEMTTEIPHWQCVTTQIWVMLLIGWKFASSNQKHYPGLVSDTSSVWNSCGCFSDVTSWGNQWWRQEVWPFSQAIHTHSDWKNQYKCFCWSVSVAWMECDRVCCAQSRSKRANKNMCQRSPLGFITIVLWKINDSVRFFGPWVPDHVTTILWH